MMAEAREYRESLAISNMPLEQQVSILEKTASAETHYSKILSDEETQQSEVS